MSTTLKEIIEELVDEANAMGGGGVVGYMGVPLGAIIRKQHEGESEGLLTASPELHKGDSKLEEHSKGHGANQSIAHLPGMGGVPTHKPFQIKSMGLIKNQGVENIKRVYNSAPDNIKEYWGKWYHIAHDQIQQLTDDYQRFQISFKQIAAMAAVLSPASSWELTLYNVDRMLRDWTTRGFRDKYANYGANIEKAKDILFYNTVDPIKFVKGAKVLPFYLSIIDPEGIQTQIDRMVLDRHAINIWKGIPNKVKETKATDKEMIQMRRDYISAAEELGIPISNLQAVTWYVWQKAIRSAGYSLKENKEKRMLWDIIEEIVNQSLMDKMGYERVDGFKGNDIYVGKGDSSDREKGIVHQVCKNLSRPVHRLDKKPPLVGISID